MRLRLFLIFVLICGAIAARAADHPMRGVALVIGESKYEQLPVLANPQKDARDIDRLLGDLGFEVDRVLNADGEELHDAIARFIEEAASADVALVYYSGHGIEAKGENFLAPTDTDLSSPAAAGESMVAVQPMLEALSKAAPVTIVLLDACRSDPFPAGQMIVLPGDSAPTPVTGQGLAAVRGPTPVARPDADPAGLGSVIGFAAEPGAPALDGAPGENSPYASALLKHFAAGGYSFGDVMTMVTQEVYLKTKAKQLPWTNSSLRTVLRFDAAADASDDADAGAIKTERRKLLLTIAGTPAQTRSYVEALAGEENVPLDALYGMLDVLGVKATDAGGDLQQQLQKGAERLKQLLAEKSTSVKSDPDLERLSKLADDAEAEGAMALALKYRDEASRRADTLLEGKRAEADKLRQDMVDIADTYAANAATALLNFDQLHAAELFGKAFDAVSDWDKVKAVSFKMSQGDALIDRGYYTTDNDALDAALKVYSEAQALTPKDTDTRNWAKLQDRIGQVQQMLGARGTDSELLTASIASFKRALEVTSQTAEPSDWAVGQNNLGNVLYSLGSRTRDTALLSQSVASFDAALTVFTAAETPVRWAIAQSNRASAQMSLADTIYASTQDAEVQAFQAGNTNAETIPEVVEAKARAVAILSDSIASLDTTLASNPLSDNPLDRAMIEHTRAALLSDRGKLLASADDVKASADAFRGLLSVYDKTRMPVQWTTTAANLATTLRQLSGLTKDGAPLAEATDLLQQGIAMTPKDKSPVDWAELQTKLGNVWTDLVEFDNKVETSDKAVAAYRAAMTINTPEYDLSAWERLQLYTVQILLKTAVPLQDVPRLKDARETAALTSETLKANDNPESEIFAQWLPVLDQFIEALSK